MTKTYLTFFCNAEIKALCRIGRGGAYAAAAPAGGTNNDKAAKTAAGLLISKADLTPERADK